MWSRVPQTWRPALTSMGCGALGQSFNLSKPQFPPLQSGGNSLHKQKGLPWRVNEIKCVKNLVQGISLVVLWLRVHAPNAGGQGSISGQGPRPHMLQLKLRMPQLKILHATIKDPVLCNCDLEQPKKYTNKY